MAEVIRSKKMITDRSNGMYEGNAPYIFISYSHRNIKRMTTIRDVLRQGGGRFWYDDGLHSGDDWNMEIASHLERAAVCLLLLSRESAESEYVKNELNFAQNHRIPIHVILVEQFVLPIDIEMMLGRIQMIEMTAGYEQKLLESLPGELFDSSEQSEISPKGINHPLYQVGDEISNRQGTISYHGIHKSLGYEVLVQADRNTNISSEAMLAQTRMVANLSYPVFPQIYDVMIRNGDMYTFQEYREEVFLDRYLKEHQLQEAEIVEWITAIIEAVDYLYSQNLGFRDFARGSLVVTRDKRLAMTRLQNYYYGIIRLQVDNRQYYFEKEVEEIAVLLYQLCTGEIPVLPLRMLTSDRLSKNFVDKVNLILQKSMKENHQIKYSTFREIIDDLNLKRIAMGDARFLNKRRAKLREYEAIKINNLSNLFTRSDSMDNIESLEARFHIEETVYLSDPLSVREPFIKIRICSTGQVVGFAKDEITIGRDHTCDLVLNQPRLSRLHAHVRRTGLFDDLYELEVMSMNTVFNDSFITWTDQKAHKIVPGQRVQIWKGDIIQLAQIKLQIC